MDKNRMIQILADTCEIDKSSLSADMRKLIMADEALTAMQRAVEEETSVYVDDTIRLLESEIESLRAEVERLKQCEAIVRELAERYNPYQMNPLWRIEEKARQWVRENPE